MGERGVFPMEVKKSIPMKTALYNEHKKLGAKIINFHGWEMPLEYSSIIKEHMAVRTNVGIFDISHMGDIVISGYDSDNYVDHIFPSKVSELNKNECMYTAFLNDLGNMIDDTIIYRLSKEKFFLIPNASNINKIYMWMLDNKGNYDVDIYNYSDLISHIAVQGQKSEQVINNLGMKFPESFKFIYNQSNEYNIITGNSDIVISGTGYTGERGVELIVPNKIAGALWESLLKEVYNLNGTPCGLGSRDTLRMEKGMLLSGQDFHEDKNPYESSISFIINLEHDFIGKEALIKEKIQYNNIFRGFKLETKNIPRNGFDIFANNKAIGKITSGTISPILNTGIGLGYISREYSKIGTEVYVKIRENEVKAEVTKPRIIK
jgi:aminomethyltransferase